MQIAKFGFIRTCLEHSFPNVRNAASNTTGRGQDLDQTTRRGAASPIHGPTVNQSSGDFGGATPGLKAGNGVLNM